MSKKIFLVNRDFQLRYTGAGLVAGIVSTAITATLILYPLFTFKILTVGMFLPWPIFAGMAIALILNIVVQLFFGIVMTHKVAGPMFSLVRYIRKISSGQWNVHMYQRSGDDLQMLVRHVNELSENLVIVANNDLEALARIKSEISQVNTEQARKDFILSNIDKLISDISHRVTPPAASRSQNQ